MTILSNRSKRVLKRIGKKIIENKESKHYQDPRILIHRVTNESYDGYDVAYLVAAKDRNELEHAMRFCENLDGYDFTSAYDCTGRPFYAPANIKQVCDDRFYVTFSVSYDV